MDEEFNKFLELTEMYGPAMLQPGIEQNLDNPELESLWKKFDSLTSSVGDVRDSIRKFLNCESDKDRDLYSNITYEHSELVDKLWASIKNQIQSLLPGGPEEEEGEEEEGGEEEPEKKISKTFVIKQYPEED